MLNNLTNSWNDDESERGCDLCIHRSHMLRAFIVVPVFEKPLSKHEVDLPRGSKLELYWHRCRLHWSFIRCSHWLVIERRDNRKYIGSHVEYMSQFGTRVVAEICHAKQNISFSSQSPHHDNDAVVMFPVTCLLFGAQRKATYPGYYLCHSYPFWGCNHDWQQTGKPQAEEVRMYWWSNPSHFTTVKQGYCPSVFPGVSHVVILFRGDRLQHDWCGKVGNLVGLPRRIIKSLMFGILYTVHCTTNYYWY
jgi:hypothetical protein